MSRELDEFIIRSFINDAYVQHQMPNQAAAHEALDRLIAAPRGTPPNQGSGAKPPPGSVREVMTAYRRGKAAGYTQGIVDGWDHCKQHIYNAYEHALRIAMIEPEPIRKHREATTREER